MTSLLSLYFNLNAIFNKFSFSYSLTTTVFYYAPYLYSCKNFRHYFPFGIVLVVKPYFKRHHSFVDKLFWLLHNECLHIHLICARLLCYNTCVLYYITHIQALNLFFQVNCFNECTYTCLYVCLTLLICLLFINFKSVATVLPEQQNGKQLS